jgi:hypothetical protein
VQVELLFPVLGEQLPIDHAYPLFAALSGAIREFHLDGGGMRFAPINGEKTEKKLLRISGKSRLRIRVESESITKALPLTGRSLSVGGYAVSLGPPTVISLIPAPTLYSKLVTFKLARPRSAHRARPGTIPTESPEEIVHGKEPVDFLETARQKLAEHGIEGIPGLPLVTEGPHAGQPRRKIVRIKGKAIVGYSLLIEGLTAEESIQLQEKGLGGRTRIGCGFFLPYREKAS